MYLDNKRCTRLYYRHVHTNNVQEKQRWFGSPLRATRPQCLGPEGRLLQDGGHPQPRPGGGS